MGGDEETPGLGIRLASSVLNERAVHIGSVFSPVEGGEAQLMMRSYHVFSKWRYY